MNCFFGHRGTLNVESRYVQDIFFLLVANGLRNARLHVVAVSTVQFHSIYDHLTLSDSLEVGVAVEESDLDVLYNWLKSS